MLELGAGLGVSSLAAVKLGAAMVVATDGSLESAETLQYNLRRNQQAEEVGAHHMPAEPVLRREQP